MSGQQQQQQDDGRGYRVLTAEDGRNYAKRMDPRTLAGSQVSGTLVPVDAPTSVKLADVAERHADMFNADDLAVINASVVELQDYELKNAGASIPVNVDVPYASQEGDVLKCTMGNWDGEPTSYNYQWAFDGVNVGTPADVSDYVIAVADAGKTATCVVFAANDAGTSEAPASNPVVIEAPAAREA